MITYILAIKDRAIDAFMRPFMAQHRMAGIRAFQDELNRADSEMGKHPEDYDLYYIDAFDDTTGMTVDRPDRPELLVRAQDLITNVRSDKP